jgi:hypothetical protein
MKEIESISSALFDKIRSRFDPVTLGDENAKAEQNPEKARFFNFTYRSNDGAKFGKVTISLIDEDSLKVYYGQNISGEMDREHRREWYKFLRNMRDFARRNLLTFDTRDINKSSLELKDIKQQSKSDDTYKSSDVAVTESKLYGSSHRSYSDMGGTRLRIHHEGMVNDDVHGDRTRHIKEIFIETSRGERFLLPFTNLHGARAMARHVNEGGAIQDEIGESICRMVKEMSAMRHFVRATKHRQFEDQETADMTQSAINHYEAVKQMLRNLKNKRKYNEFVQTFVPESPIEDEVDIKALRERFVKKVYDDRFTDALPIVYRAHKRQQTEASARLGNELEEWADEISEGTWAAPDSQEQIAELQKLMQTPLLTGIDGVDATNALHDIIGNDALFDEIYHLSQDQGPDADVRPMVKVWLQNNMPEVLSQVEFGRNNADDAQTNTVAPVSPQMPTQQYGDNQMDEPVTDPVREDLEFIRILSGLRR